MATGHMYGVGDMVMWFEIVDMGHDVWRIEELYINRRERGLIYFVRGRDHDLLIDGGYGLVPLRPNLPLIDHDRTVFVATHTHFDHIGGAWEFPERWVHPLEADVLAAPTQENTLIRPYGIEIAGEGLFDRVPPAWTTAEDYHIKPAPATGLLQDGDVIDLGNRRFEVLHTPGHTAGSISLWEETTGVLFSSDVLYNGRLLDELKESNIPDLLRSHERLAQLPIKVVHPGHYESFSGEKGVALMAAYQLLRGD